MSLQHEEYRNHIGRGLAEANQLINYTGSGTYQSAATTIQNWKDNNNAQFAGAAIHETDKALAQIANRHVDNLNAMGIYTATEVAASNDTATWRAQFTAQDPTFPAAYNGSRG